MPKAALNDRLIGDAICPPDKPNVLYWDTDLPGFCCRVTRAGKRYWFLTYRPAGSRSVKWYKLGEWPKLGTEDARAEARLAKRHILETGFDPVTEKRQQKQTETDLETALTAYERSLEKRGVVRRDLYMSLLRRELLKPLGNVKVKDITRRDLTKRFEQVEASGRQPNELRTRTNTFLNWCTNQGITEHNVLAGYRMERRTRAERLQQAGRSLSDNEIPKLWKAAEKEGWPFGLYLQTLLLTGQRRTETTLMQWQHVDLDKAVWTIPAEVTKAGRAHEVPLPAVLVEKLRDAPKVLDCPYVFPGRGNKPMTGWSKRIKGVQAEAGLEPWTLHDLRRTMRSGLARLGVDVDVAELMLNHQLKDYLQRAYNRDPMWSQRQAAAEAWAKHVLSLTKPKIKKRPLKRKPL